MQHPLAHRTEEGSRQPVVPGRADNQQVLRRGREYQAGDWMISDDFRVHGDIRVTVAPAGKRFGEPHFCLFRRGW